MALSSCYRKFRFLKYIHRLLPQFLARAFSEDHNTPRKRAFEKMNGHHLKSNLGGCSFHAIYLWPSAGFIIIKSNWKERKWIKKIIFWGKENILRERMKTPWKNSLFTPWIWSSKNFGRVKKRTFKKIISDKKLFWKKMSRKVLIKKYKKF